MLVSSECESDLPVKRAQFKDNKNIQAVSENSLVPHCVASKSEVHNGRDLAKCSCLW